MMFNEFVRTKLEAIGSCGPKMTERIAERFEEAGADRLDMAMAFLKGCGNAMVDQMMIAVSTDAEFEAIREGLIEFAKACTRDELIILMRAWQLHVLEELRGKYSELSWQSVKLWKSDERGER